MTTAFIGQPISRVDGRRKVTGAATYAAEFEAPGLAHGAVVRSTVANGRIASIDSSAAQRAPGRANPLAKSYRGSSVHGVAARRSSVPKPRTSRA